VPNQNVSRRLPRLGSDTVCGGSIPYSGVNRIHALTVVDNFNRGRLAIGDDHRLTGIDVVATVDYLKMFAGLAKRTQVDNGSEFTSEALDKWDY
jgi:transposase InsO family protein